MKDLKFLDKVKYPFDANTFAEMQEDYKLFEQTIAGLLGAGNFIISGCQIDSSGQTSIISSGLMYINGELVRFSGGDYFGINATYIVLTTANTVVNHDGINYTVNSEKIANTSNSSGMALFDTFITVGKLRRDNEFLSLSFSPFSNISGITVLQAKVSSDPHHVSIRAQFTVDLAALNNPDNIINIDNWGNSQYGQNNINKVVGTYTLFLISGSNEAEVHRGLVLGSDESQLFLMKPYTLSNMISGIAHAKFSDLAVGQNVSYTKYRIDLEAQLLV